MSWPRIVTGAPTFVTEPWDGAHDVIYWRVEWPPLRIVLDGLIPTLTFPC